VPEELSAAEEKRWGVDVVDVIMALPTSEEGNAAPDKHGKVFAFLPIDSYGFRCVLECRIKVRLFTDLMLALHWDNLVLFPSTVL
jgi:hypothetical protein